MCKINGYPSAIDTIDIPIFWSTKLYGAICLETHASRYEHVVAKKDHNVYFIFLIILYFMSDFNYPLNTKSLKMQYGIIVPIRVIFTINIEFWNFCLKMWL